MKKTSLASLRNICRVFNTYQTKRIGSQHGTNTWIVADKPRIARRAYVEACLTYLPTRLYQRDTATVLEIAGEVVAVSVAGRLLSCKELSLSPRCIAGYVDRATEALLGHFVRIAEARGAEVTIWHPALKAVRKRWVTPSIVGNIKQFLSGLDQDVMRLIRRVGLASEPAVYNWLTPACDTTALRRRQALAIFPTPLVLAKPWNPLGPGVLIERSIDAGRPLIDDLASMAKVRKATIRRLTGVLPQRAIGQLSNRPGWDYAVLDALPERLWPQTKADYHAARQLARVIAVVGNPGLIRSLPCDRPLAQQTGLINPKLAGELKDVVDCARRTLREPRAFLDRCGLSALVRLNEGWHRSIVIEAAKQHTTSRWSAGFGPLTVSHEGLVLKELTTGAELVAEGCCLAHCIATYASRAINGCCRLISVRTLDGQPVSSMEVDDAGRVRQHYAYRNSEPPLAAKELQRLFEAAIKADRILIATPWPRLPSQSQTTHVDMRAFWSRRSEVKERGIEAEAEFSDDFLSLI